MTTSPDIDGVPTADVRLASLLDQYSPSQGHKLSPHRDDMNQHQVKDDASASSHQQSPVSSPATSISALSTSTQPILDAGLFFADLSNYLPLGCLITEVKELGLESDPDSLAVIDQWNFDELLTESLRRLIEARWIHVRATIPLKEDNRSRSPLILKLFVLPHDVGRRFVDRTNRKLQRALEYTVKRIIISSDVWNGRLLDSDELEIFDPWATGEDTSLFYLFNTLPSPSPSISKVQNRFAKAAMKQLLNGELTGLNAKLYPFQSRSAALMLQRETTQELFLDPRFELRRAPNGEAFYWNPREATFFRNARLYESSRGGILSESMGLGKTIIAISLILATKGHLPKVPPEYQTGPTVRECVGSLAQMAASAVARHSVPWKCVLERHERKTGEYLAECFKLLSATPPQYEVPVQPVRFNRSTTLPPPQKMTMCSGTLIVVPRNLLSQWQSELAKHVEEGNLKVLVLDSPRKAVPPVQELATYDLVLFSRTRFELEIRDGTDDKGRRVSQGAPSACQCPYIGASRTRQCTCLKEDDIYISPLKHLHWLRIMIDEGHSFSSKNSNAVLVAQKIVRAERRWIVSGTPGKDDLLGVEIDLSSNQTEGRSLEEDSQLVRDLVLEQRKRFDAEDSIGAAKSLGTLAAHFLQIRPWAKQTNGERAEWNDYIYRHEDFRRYTFTGFSKCLRKTLEQLIVKTQPDDVERDISLPPLTHRVVRLDPCYFDKLSANLFILVLTGNAVTSERTDIDYLFHPKSQRSRNQLITNLRQANFFWTGFSEGDVTGAIENGRRYLQKPHTNCSKADRVMLEVCIAFAKQLVLSSEKWRAMSATHEIGLFARDWPEGSSTWALGKESPELYGVAQLLQAQAYVNERLSENPTDGLEEAGIAAVAQAYAIEDPEKHAQNRGAEGSMKMGLPSSSVHAETSVSKLHNTAAAKNNSPTKNRRRSNIQNKAEEAKAESSSNPTRKRPRTLDNGQELPDDSPLRRTTIIGTVSSKLSYLLDQVMRYYKEEKIIIFYDGDNAAYYLAQCLDLLDIKHEIYAKGLSNEMRSRYIVTFDRDPTIRVLLMDVRLGALGLNVNQASRVYFINPVCRPGIEAQAIKRAHRIGQTKPVYVETLILRGTIEEAIFERSKAMTRTEHHEAKTLEDDQKITDIIKAARLLPVHSEEGIGERQMALLNTPQQLFGRPGREIKSKTSPAAKLQASASANTDSPSMPKSKKQRKSTSKGKAKSVIPENHTLTTPIRNSVPSRPLQLTSPEPNTAMDLDGTPGLAQSLEVWEPAPPAPAPHGEQQSQERGQAAPQHSREATEFMLPPIPTSLFGDGPSR